MPPKKEININDYIVVTKSSHNNNNTNQSQTNNATVANATIVTNATTTVDAANADATDAQPAPASPTSAAPNAATTSLPTLNISEIVATEQKQQLYLANAKLCRLVRKCPWMYDRNHDNYAKKQILDKSWTKIAKDCNDSVPSCKERWRNIRAAFARSINIYKTQGGPNRVKPYYLYKELSFLVKPMSEGRDRLRGETDGTKEELQSDEDYEEEEDEEQVESAEGEDEEPVKESEKNITVAHNVTDESIHVETVVENSASDDEAELNFTEEPLQELLETSKENEFHSGLVVNSTMAAAATSTTTTADCSRETAKRSHDSDIDMEEQPDIKRIRLNWSKEPNEMLGHEVDAKFLDALLPDMYAMNARQKIIFKRKIYQSLEEVFETATDFPHNNNANESTTAQQQQQQQPKHFVISKPTTLTTTAHNVLDSVSKLNEAELEQLQKFIQTDLKRKTVEIPVNVAQVGTVTVRRFAQQNSITNPAAENSLLITGRAALKRNLTIAAVTTNGGGTDGTSSGGSGANLTTVNGLRISAMQPSKALTVTSTTSSRSAAATNAAVAAAVNGARLSHKLIVRPVTASTTTAPVHVREGVTTRASASPWHQVVPITIKDEFDDVDID